MIFHCPKCRSKYKIDDDIITEKGINVKCHKCGNIFFVKKKEDVELTNIISGIKENISRWEEKAKSNKEESISTLQSDSSETKEAVIDEETVNDFLSEIEFDILKEKELPGEERLKELLTDESVISADKTIKEESIIEKSKEEESKEKEPNLHENAISSVMIEADDGKQPVENQEPLNLELKPDGFSRQDDMDEFLSDVLDSTTGEKTDNEPGILEKDSEISLGEPAITTSAPPGTPQPPSSENENNMDINLDKLLDDTVTELDIDNKIGAPVKKDDSGLDDKDITKSEENVGGKVTEDMEKGADIPVSDVRISEEHTEVEGESDTEIKDEIHETMVSDSVEEIESKVIGFRENLKVKWQNFIFLLSSYFSVFLKKTIIWKLAILSVAGIVAIGGITGITVIGWKKLILRQIEEKEIVVKIEEPQMKEHLVDKSNLEEKSEAIEKEKPAEQMTPHPPPSVGENSVRVDAILPVPFSPDENKVMSIKARLELENREGMDVIQSNLPYYEEIIEDSVDQFFKDKFYEDTHFVKEKLKEVILRKINENIKNGRVRKVDLEEIKVK